MQTNYFGRLLTDLQDYIKTAVPEIRWIDNDMGQLETFEYRQAVDFPCCLIDFGITQYDEMGELAQVGTPQISFRIGYAPFSQSNSSAPLNVREKANEYFEIEQKLYEALQGWYNEFTTPLIRISAGTERRDDTIRVRVLTFSTSYEDNSAIPFTQRVPAALNLDTEN